jgi:recombinational DNA repair protein RecT
MKELTKIIKNNELKLWDLRPSHLRIGKELYFRLALMDVMKDNKLLSFANSEKGAKSIFKCISEALQIGLLFGSHIPHCYIIGFDSKKGPTCSLIISAEGYKYIALKHVLSDIQINIVYEGEKFKIDYANNNIIHEWDSPTELGKIVGVCGILIPKEFRSPKKVEFISIKKIHEIRDNYSKAYARDKAEKRKGIWDMSYEEMILKTAAKKFLKPFSSIKEGEELAKVFNMEDDQNDDNDIGDRMSDKLDNIIDVDLPESDLPSEEKEQKKEPQENKKSKDLF